MHKKGKSKDRGEIRKRCGINWEERSTSWIQEMQGMPQSRMMPGSRVAEG